MNQEDVMFYFPSHGVAIGLNLQAVLAGPRSASNLIRDSASSKFSSLTAIGLYHLKRMRQKMEC
jgi:hypothetical protein